MFLYILMKILNKVKIFSTLLYFPIDKSSLALLVWKKTQQDALLLSSRRLPSGEIHDEFIQVTFATADEVIPQGSPPKHSMVSSVILQ